MFAPFWKQQQSSSSGSLFGIDVVDKDISAELLRPLLSTQYYAKCLIPLLSLSFFISRYYMMGFFLSKKRKEAASRKKDREEEEEEDRAFLRSSPKQRDMEDFSLGPYVCATVLCSE